MKLAKPLVEAIKKISKGTWKWKPEQGEWCVNKEGGYAQLVSDVDKETGDIYLSSPSGHVWLHSVNFIPILYWERIVKILEGMGYYVGINRFKPQKQEKAECYCEIWKDGVFYIKIFGNNYQQVTMQAVVGLVGGKDD